MVAENDGQDMADHGGAFEDFDGIERDEDGAGGDGGDADAGEMFGEAAFVEHVMKRIPGLWEETNAEALRSACVYACGPIPSTLTHDATQY